MRQDVLSFAREQRVAEVALQSAAWIRPEDLEARIEAALKHPQQLPGMPAYVPKPRAEEAETAPAEAQ